jgi:Methylmalonyl-CoA mutase
MHIDDFSPNLSFFFSNGMNPEYSVIDRVARRIRAVAMKNKYGANLRGFAGTSTVNRKFCPTVKFVPRTSLRISFQFAIETRREDKPQTVL